MSNKKDLSFMKFLSQEVKDYSDAKLEKMATNIMIIIEKRKKELLKKEKKEEAENKIKREIVQKMIDNKIKIPTELRPFIPKKEAKETDKE